MSKLSRQSSLAHRATWQCSISLSLSVGHRSSTLDSATAREDSRSQYCTRLRTADWRGNATRRLRTSSLPTRSNCRHLRSACSARESCGTMIPRCRNRGLQRRGQDERPAQDRLVVRLVVLYSWLSFSCTCTFGAAASGRTHLGEETTNSGAVGALLVLAIAVNADAICQTAAYGQGQQRGDAAAVRLAALTPSAAAEALEDLRAVDDPDAAGVRAEFRSATRHALEAASRAYDSSPTFTVTAFDLSLEAAEAAERFGDAFTSALKARGELEAVIPDAIETQAAVDEARRADSIFRAAQVAREAVLAELSCHQADSCPPPLLGGDGCKRLRLHVLGGRFSASRQSCSSRQCPRCPGCSHSGLGRSCGRPRRRKCR